MKMKTFFSIWLLLVMAGMAAAAESRPNILLILADDLGWADTTLYGKTSLYETPNIERLAARGMTFASAYASPICSPTRASILTGQNPARHGMTAPAGHLNEERFEPEVNASGPSHQKSTNVRSSTRVDPKVRMLPQLLKDAGYATAHFGKWHLGRSPHSPLERGFDVDVPHWWGAGPKSGYLAPWGYTGEGFKEGGNGEHIEDRMAKEAVTWLRNRDRTKPFFMNYWQFSVHAPFGAKSELIDHYRKKLGKSVDELSAPEVIQRRLSSQMPSVGLPQQSPTYAAMVHSLDDAVGRLLDALEEEGIADETIIIFYSDNGGNIHCGLEETAASGEQYVTPITSNHPLRGGKGGIHEGGIRVPAVVVWPGVTEPGSRSDVLIQANDLYPTILRMVQVSSPDGHLIDGVDFTVALRGEAMQRGPMFTYVPVHGASPHWLPPSMSVHHGDWKLVRIFHYGENGAHDYRLYNLSQDITENENVAATFPRKLQELDKLIDEFIADANVVVPLPNPKFEQSQFDREAIGVQPGGLKMPPRSKTPQSKSARTKSAVRLVQKTQTTQKTQLGWVVKNGNATVNGTSLKVSSADHQSFVTNAKIQMTGPVEAVFRIRPKKDGFWRVQWRTAGQESFPNSGQEQSFEVVGRDWQELRVPLQVEGILVHLRLFFSDKEQQAEIDWIELQPTGGGPQNGMRWDFGPPPQAPAAGISPTEHPASLPDSVGLRPNVLLIVADDLGYGELGCYGNPDAKTPSIDRLAASGVRCTDGYAAFPVCSPARAALLTGRYPHRYGPTYEDYYGGGSPELDPKTHPTIAQMMKDAGYRTACFGKWNVSNLKRRQANDFGFDRWVGLHLNHDYYTHKLLRTGELDMYVDGRPFPDCSGTWSDTVFADDAIRFLKENTDSPFFIYLAFQAPHTPIQDPEVPMDRPQESNRPTLVKMIERLDFETGRVLQALDDRQMAGNTLVILTSDNGGDRKVGRNLPLRGSKQMLEEGGIRVPYIVRWPDVLPQGIEFTEPVSAYDLTATVAAAGRATPAPEKPFDGVDLVPVLTGAAELDGERPLFFRRRNISVRKNQNEIRQSAVRQGDWKYIRTYKPVGSNHYAAVLYNVRGDLSEKNDLAKEHPAKLKAMSDILDNWESEVEMTAASFNSR